MLKIKIFGGLLQTPQARASLTAFLRPHTCAVFLYKNNCLASPVKIKRQARMRLQKEGQG